MEIGIQIKKVLHHYGIHNATVQPEFVPVAEGQSIRTMSPAAVVSEDGDDVVEVQVESEETTCLLRCLDVSDRLESLING
jgi:hypothetical protein